MTFDEICKMTSNPQMLNVLHACRENHPMNNRYQWRNAWMMAACRNEISLAAVGWLHDKAEDEFKRDQQ